MPHPTLSIGIANYNHAEVLPAALDSILQQSWQDFELILIDDASTDNSLEILRNYAQRYPSIRLIENKRNQGILPNIPTLLSLATGEFYYAAAADDFILPGFLEKTISLLSRYPSAGLCSTLYYVTDREGKNRDLPFPDPFGSQQPDYHFGPEVIRRHFETRMPWIQGNTVIYRKAALIGVGGFRPELRSFCDGFVQHVIALRHGACFIPEPLAVCRLMPGSYSQSISINPATSRSIRDEAWRCMTEVHRDLFPPEYIRRWRSRWDSDAMMAFARAQCGELKSGLQRLLPGDSRINILARILWEMGVSLGFVFIAVAAVILRWFDIPMLVRKRIGRLCRFGSRHQFVHGATEKPSNL